MEGFHDMTLRGEVQGKQLVLTAVERVGLVRHLPQNLVKVEVDSRRGARGGVTIHQLDPTATIHCPNHLRNEGVQGEGRVVTGGWMRLGFRGWMMKGMG